MLAVVGCHRSGTSAAAGALHRLGWYLGPDLMPPSPDNPKGYYESMPLVRLHEAALHRAGMSWHSATVLGDDWLESFGARQAHVRARLFLQRCKDGMQSNALALKDPRLCMFRRLWQCACQAEGFQLRALLVVRHDHSVVQSLCRRDKFKVEYAKDLKQRHAAGMDDWQEHVPYGVVGYEDLLEDWRKVLGDAFDQLGFPTLAYADQQGAVDEYLDEGLNHA